MKSRLARYGSCAQVMPIPRILQAFKPCAPLPLYPLELPFHPAQESQTPPAIVPMEIGEYPPKQRVLPGMILANNSGFLPPGYLVCNGAEISRETYEILFKIIGTYYGDGNYTTTFNLPQLSNTSNPNTIYIIKYDLYSDTVPHCPPVPSGSNTMPVSPTEINIQILCYPLNYVPPPGTILFNQTDSLPPGYLACDGALISRETYSVLFNMIGTYYGDGFGTTMFNLPNLVNGNSPPYRYIIRYLNPMDN